MFSFGAGGGSGSFLASLPRPDQVHGSPMGVGTAVHDALIEMELPLCHNLPLPMGVKCP